MKFYEFIEVKEWQNVHIRFNNESHFCCGEHIPNNHGQQVINQAANIIDAKHMAVNLIKEYDNQNIGVCGGCECALYVKMFCE